MAGIEPRSISFRGVRLRYESEKTFDDLVQALLTAVGEKPVMIEEIAAASTDWETYREAVEMHVGAWGFMLFGTFDHGGWLSKAGIDRKVLRVIIGNPLIAITMLRHDVTAGLFAPVELLVVDQGDDHSSLIYVQPSSLMVVDQNEPLLTAARDLDSKLAELASAIV